jgi:hypothetical protein
MILVTGQARSGTSLLFTFFGFNGFDTGYNEKHFNHLQHRLSDNGRSGNSYSARGGGEFLKDHKNKHVDKYPEVIKHPYEPSGPNPKWRLESVGLTPDHVVITRRDPRVVAESQIDMLTRRNKIDRMPSDWARPTEESVRLRYVELESCFPNAIWVDFPRFVTDFDYLWGKLGHLMNASRRPETREKFEALANPEFVRFQ